LEWIKNNPDQAVVVVEEAEMLHVVVAIANLSTKTGNLQETLVKESKIFLN
jgi:hypothetical protein